MKVEKQEAVNIPPLNGYRVEQQEAVNIPPQNYQKGNGNGGSIARKGQGKGKNRRDGRDAAKEIP